MKKQGWKHVVGLVCCGLPGDAQRFEVRGWEWVVRRGLEKRWDWMRDVFGWGRGFGLGEGRGVFEEWVTVKRGYEAECERFVESLQ
jgi:hypothetical protein